MNKITRRIDKLCDKANQHCGYEDRVADYLRYRGKGLRFIAAEFEKGESK